MRGLVFYGACSVLAAVLLVAVIGAPPASSDSASIGDGGPSPTPMYAPDGSATIDVFFTLDGIPTIGLAPIWYAIVDGEFCTGPAPIQVVFFTLSWPVQWPFSNSVNPLVCSEIGAPVTLCRNPSSLCSEEFIFTGEDASVRLEMPQADAHRVEANFVTDNGQPSSVEFRQVSFLRGSLICFESVPAPGIAQAPLVHAQAFTMYWSAPVSESCTLSGSEIPITAVFSTADHGNLSAAFVWEGEDVTKFDVVVPDIATATPSPSPPSTVSPTPTPSTAAVTASPTPYPQSLITVKFVRDGEPVTVGYSIAIRMADGVGCFGVSPAVPMMGEQFQFSWPLGAGPDQPSECSKGPPTSIVIEFHYGGGAFFVAQLLWEGSDVTIDVEVPLEATLETPTPTATANALPDTGGPPVDERGGAGLLLGALALLLATAAAFFVSARVRQGG